MLNITSTVSTHAIQSVVAMSRALCDMSASRGILASQQGIRLSSGSDLGVQVFASKVQAPEHKIVIKQDEPMGAWHLADAYRAAGVSAAESGTNPADLLTVRLRNTHLATVNRSRHRSRLR
ncbi:hypothetical protein [Nocardia crassostreae]|uniref:hypothetical protein n=1 Tax=Nocardia crassostreae TaxID=53428 RepID=UPI000834C71C|nr:hypothetical protein [Nocardia crassostreae]